ncbi:MAG: hypothetical protein M3281_00925, partial [Chloroflexota bacterium]|nr:hypothetical protein [Chloroflexota bacterium]
MAQPRVRPALAGASGLKRRLSGHEPRVALTAALALGATPAQMGALGVAGSLPNLLFGLLAGVWVDRTRRRPVLIAADLGRALLLASIPAAALLDALTLAQVYIVAFAAATLGIWFTLASVAVLP